MNKKRGLTWRTRLTLLILVFSIVPLVAIAVWGYSTSRQMFEESALQSLTALANTKADVVNQQMETRQTDVERIASLVAPELERALAGEPRSAPAQTSRLPGLKDAEVLPEPGEAGAPARGSEKKPPAVPPKAEAVPVDPRRAVLKQTLQLILWDQRVFEELLVLDASGRVVASTFDEHEETNAAEIAYFERGRRATFVQPVFLSPITNQLTMVIATPIRSQKAEDLGVLAARLNLKRFFLMVGDTTGLGASGETVVAKKDGDRIVFMAPTRHDPQAALSRTLEIGAPRAKPLQEAALGQKGSGVAIDYRGVEALTAWRFVPSVEWGLEVKIDRAEALAGVSLIRTRTLLMTLLLFLLVIPTALWAARALLAPLKELQLATDRISRGDFKVQLSIDSPDEIGELADSFERMMAAIKYFREHAQKPEEEDDLDDPQGGRPAT